MRWSVWITIAVLLGLLPTTMAAEPSGSVEGAAGLTEILQEMRSKRSDFEPDKLQELGIDGLSALMDWLLPQTAGNSLQVPTARIDALIRDLGSDRYKVRHAAAEQLYQIGPPAAAALREATKNNDTEVMWSAARLMRRLEAEWMPSLLPAAKVYLRDIRDQPRLEELARRVNKVLATEAGNEAQFAVIQECIGAIAQSGGEDVLNRLQPLLKHANPTVRRTVVQATQNAPAGRAPMLLSEALRSNLEDVVQLAIQTTVNRGDNAKHPEIERALLTVFHGKNEDLRFQASYPLVLIFENREATEYVLEQAAGAAQPGRRSQAARWQVNARMRGRTVVACAFDGMPAPRWRYTFNQPGMDWRKAAFDDTGWREGTAGFGSKGTPGALIGTEWKTADVWIRRTFELQKVPDRPCLRIAHDDDVKVYINGELVAKLEGFTNAYVLLPLGDEAKRALKPGKNTLAVQCHQLTGGQYIDVGVAELPAAR